MQMIKKCVTYVILSLKSSIVICNACKFILVNFNVNVFNVKAPLFVKIYPAKFISSKIKTYPRYLESRYDKSLNLHQISYVAGATLLAFNLNWNEKV